MKDAGNIASRGRVGKVSGSSLASIGRLKKGMLLLVRSSVNVFLQGFSLVPEAIKIFRAVTEMDRTFEGESEM